MRDPLVGIHRIRSARISEYSVTFDAVLDPARSTLKDWLEGEGVLLVTTPTVSVLYRDFIRRTLIATSASAEVMVLECSEPTKSLRQVEAVCMQAASLGIGRHGTLASLSGGVCSDIVTLAASLIRRGVRHIRIPTTLVGQIDAGLGAKGAVNFDGRKSFLGCFWPPEAVLIDPRFLRTLPLDSIRDGLAEIIKIALIRDHELFDIVARSGPALLASHFQSPPSIARVVIERAARGMLEELEDNLFETKTHERLVDAGHTFSPALEAECGFSLAHGHAVAIDLALSACIARKLGVLGVEDTNSVIDVLASCGLPVYSPLLSVELCRAALKECARHRGGSPNLVVPNEIGTGTFVRDVETLTPRVLEAALTDLARLADGLRTPDESIAFEGRSAHLVGAA